jgi:hypothetical protein
MNKIKEVIRTKIRFKPAVFVVPQQEGIDLRSIRRRNMKKEGWSEGISKRRRKVKRELVISATRYIAFLLYLYICCIFRIFSLLE